MARRRSAKQDLKAELDALVASLTLDDAQAGYMAERWRPQVMTAQRRADSNREWYYGWRVPTVIGALLLPPLASPTVSTSWARWAALGVSLVVAICTALEGTFRFGNRWRLYRRLLQELRAEGWQYAYGTGPYATRREFPLFVERSEDALRRYGDAYMSDVLVLGPDVRERPDRPPTEAAPRPA